MLNNVIHRIRGESVAHSGVSVSVRDLDHLVPEEVKMDEENERTPFRVVA